MEPAEDKTQYPFYLVVEQPPLAKDNQVVSLFDNRDEAEDCFVNSPYPSNYYGLRSLKGVTIEFDKKKGVEVFGQQSAVLIDTKGLDM